MQQPAIVWTQHHLSLKAIKSNYGSPRINLESILHGRVA